MTRNEFEERTNVDRDKIVQDVLQGRYGNGSARVSELKALGYDPNEVQGWVNDAVLSKLPIRYKLKIMLREFIRKLRRR